MVVAKAFNIQKRADIGRVKPGPPPPGFDYDLWVGPAPFVPFQKNRYHYTWHWWHDFGTGDMGNDGVHELDVARWGLGAQTHPKTVSALGGKYVFDDDQQFPDTQTVLFDYPAEGPSGRRRQLMFEMRIWSPYQPDDGIENGVIFYGTDGWMLVSKQKDVVKVYDAKGKLKPIGGSAPTLARHDQDFLDAVRTGKTPNAEIEIGHVSASLCHLGNIATRVGRVLNVDPKTETILGDPEAQKLTGRTYREGHWAIPKGVA